MAEPPPRRPELVPRQGQGGGAGRGQARDRLRPPHRRRRTVAGAAAGARGAAQGQGHRSQPADPRHLRAARPDPRGPPPGRARPARIPAAAPDQAVDPPVADPRRHRLPRTRREPARDGPADHPDADQQDEGARRAGAPAARDRARGRDRRLWPTVGIVGYTNAGKSTLLNALVGSEVARRGQAVRDARSDQPPGQARRRSDGDRHRHRGLHPQAAAPAGRCLPGDPRGGQSRRRPARGHRRRRRTRRSTGGRSSPCSTSSGPATSRASWPSTRPT